MSSSKNKLRPASVLEKLPRAPHYIVAYSGGVDSHVLLQLLAAQRDALSGALSAVHVNHQIQRGSGDWEVHCRAVCEDLNLPFHCLRVDGRPRRGESPEAAARSARYRALADWLPVDAVLLTAQHRDDQAETLLLQLLRGAGPKGLAAMPEDTALGAGRLLRPLLHCSRAQILEYARQQGLRWVEDPSNSDTRYARNLLRQRVLPELRQHWPGLSKTLARAATHQADQAELAEALAVQDHAACRVSGANRCLSVNALRSLSAARQRNLLRYWIHTQGLTAPTQVVVQRIRTEVLTQRADARPRIDWPGVELHRYRDQLFVMPPLPIHDNAARQAWNGTADVWLEQAGGELGVTPARGEGLRQSVAASGLEIRFRQGGERIQPAGRGHHHALKKLFQEWQVPHWERSRIPLLFQHEILVAVAGHCVAEGFQAGANETGLLLHWRRTPESRR